MSETESKGKKILIIDDSELTLELVKKTLSAAGYEVYAASELVEFDMLLGKVRPDLVIVDIQMPEITGDTICKVLKEKYSDIRVVLFSGLSDDELKLLSERVGADGYISKKHGLKELSDLVMMVIEEVLL